MGELWRSQEMQMVQLYIQVDAAHDTIDELGRLGMVQFRDLNPHVNAFQRNFVNQVKRCDEMERKLRYFEQQVTQLNDEAKAEGLAPIKIEDEREDAIQRLSLDDLEAKFDELEKQVQEMNTNGQALSRNYNQLIELKCVLEKDEVFFRQSGQDELVREEESSLLAEEGRQGIKLRFVTGVINRKQFFLFEKILFRATRGNIFIKYADVDEDIKDPQTGVMTKKNVFIAFFQGERFESKIKKICESFNANLYPCPDTMTERKALKQQVMQRLDDLRLLLDRGWEQRTAVLGGIAEHLRLWQNRVKKEKSIYHTMNKMNYDPGRKCLIAEGWCPTSATDEVQLALRAARERSGALVPSILNIIPAKDTPPTYFKTDKFTRSFQEIVHSYGIARYREINPAVLTIITFPFQFGIMFGDLGHGFLLLLVALFLIRMEKAWSKKLPTDLLEIPFGGRYVILLMALFAMYCGSLYNELFCLPMNAGSAWEIQYGPGYPNNTFVTEINKTQRWTYAWGVDPVWKGATNELLFYNSMKMKMAVIIGVTHMTAGLFLKFLNAIHFRQPLDIFFEFIPQVTFLLSIFGYLCFMIIYKWNIDYYTQDAYNYAHNISSANVTEATAGSQQAPLLLNELIFMFLPRASNECPDACPLYPGQQTVQGILKGLAFASVPIMMFAKPVWLLVAYKCSSKRHYERVPAVNNGDSESEVEVHAHAAGGHGHGHGGKFEFGEIMIHQALETIEFVLGSISHTASYLRLWALSLAHSELATVFWDKAFYQTFEIGAGMGSPVVTGFLAVAGVSVWVAATLGVILFMETLSAFLHALRLHWVEFQSKFYKGDGHLFKPFSYVRILSGEAE